jgi:hypothetical protein
MYEAGKTAVETFRKAASRIDRAPGALVSHKELLFGKSQ